MTISICIPQYNRINYLLRSLQIIENQTYNNIEIVISDDCSTDNTEEKIRELIPIYKYPIVFSKNEINKGYDFNYRRCIELASGEYAFVIGNDDSLVSPDDITFLAEFLVKSDLPDIGFCNMKEEGTYNILIFRALETKIIGSGEKVALQNYSSFSFVGGLIYKKSTFDKYNTSKYDGSIYAQMYLGVFMVASGCSLFSIKEPLVLKDLLVDGDIRNSYRERLVKSWKEFNVEDGGLPSVMNVVINALKDAGKLKQHHIFYIFKRMYTVTYTHWLLDYRENGAYPAAVGLMLGMNPFKIQNFDILSLINKIKITIIYGFSSVIGMSTPVFIFKKFKQKIFTFFKK